MAEKLRRLASASKTFHPFTNFAEHTQSLGSGWMAGGSINGQKFGLNYIGCWFVRCIAGWLAASLLVSVRACVYGISIPIKRGDAEVAYSQGASRRKCIDFINHFPPGDKRLCPASVYRGLNLRMALIFYCPSPSSLLESQGLRGKSSPQICVRLMKMGKWLHCRFIAAAFSPSPTLNWKRTLYSKFQKW